MSRTPQPTGPPFPHLHVASGFSLRHGTAHPQRLVERAVELGMDILGLTDRDGVYGAVRFAKACLSAGLRPVLGADLAVQPGPSEASSAALQQPARRRVPVRGGATVDSRPPRVTVLAVGRAGWTRVCHAVTAAHEYGGRGTPELTPTVLAGSDGGTGLVVLLGPDSEVGRALARRRPDLAHQALERWRATLPGAELVLEAVTHLAGGVGPEVLTTTHAAHTVGLARQVGLPVVLTNLVRYLDRADAPVADVLDASRRLVPLSPRHLDRRNAEGRLKSSAEMAAVARLVADAVGGGTAQMRRLLDDTRALAERCALDPVADLGLGEVHFPEPEFLAGLPPIPGAPPVPGLGGLVGPTSADAILRARCEAALARCGREDRRQETTSRLDAELDTIRRLGYATYFLTVADVCDLVRSMGVRVAARGSGAGSLVCFLTGISGVDPLEHGLIMERFLSPLRQALPDIDIDVESARRTEIYERIFDRYGPQRVACVSMMDTYRVRHAVRDVGAALGLPPGEIDTLAKAFPHIRARDARAALHDLPELRASGLAQALDADGLSTMLTLVERLDGLPRHIALHPCGVVLSDGGLLGRTPVEPSALGFAMSQFDKDDVEDLGLLKLDVLGIRMQSAMAHAVDEVRRVDGVTVDLDDRGCVPLDDPATFRLIQSTRTLGCFQIESPGQRELVGKFAPETFTDIVIDISLFRPGPVKSDMVTPFLMARQGWRMPQYLHPDLEPVLRETCGVVVFHEQVVQVVATITGCSLAEGDEARRALGDVDGQRQVRAWFTERARARGYDAATIATVWEVLEAFASFGFCKAHAAAFALPTYQSAWLKAHHTAAFLAGVLTHDPGMYPKRLILDDARNFGIAVLSLDVNASDLVYRVERVGTTDEPPPQILDAPPRSAPPDGLPDARAYGIRLCLTDVAGMSEDEAGRIVTGRPYHSLTDFWYRARVQRPVVERLVRAGAFDSIYGIGAAAPVRRRGRVTRRDLLLEVADLDRAGRPAARAARGSRAAAPSGEQLALQLEPDTPTAGSGLPEMTDAERVRAELEILGLDASQHVLTAYQPFLRDLGVTYAADLVGRRGGAELLVAGVKVATQTPPVRSGRRVVFLTLDDTTGPIDATFFEDVQDPYALTVFHSWLLVVRGVLRRTGPRGVSLRALGCWELTRLHEAWRAEGLPAAVALMDDIGVMSEASVLGAAASRSSRPVMTRLPGAAAGTSPAAGRALPAAAATIEPDDPSGTGDDPSSERDDDTDPTRKTRAGGMGRRRVLVHASGFRQSPYADVAPAGGDVSRAPHKLWHASPGSSGR
jgi:error-prone DNA polymerase